MQELIKIDVPEGKIPIVEQTENGVIITWNDKELTYDDIVNKILGTSEYVVGFTHNITNAYDTSTTPFYKKVEVLRKLINIRNYFGKPDGTKCGYYIYKSDKCGFQIARIGYPNIYANGVVAFKEKEHAEQAIKMLGDELKYLFEHW